MEALQVIAFRMNLRWSFLRVSSSKEQNHLLHFPDIYSSFGATDQFDLSTHKASSVRWIPFSSKAVIDTQRSSQLVAAAI
jgi:hypothetical protein